MSQDKQLLASQGRRLAGFVLDAFLIPMTLLIGWIVWYLLAARRGQSPAKQLLGMHVIRENGATADLGWMLIRDLVIRLVAFGALYGVVLAILGDGVGGAINSLIFVLAALWCIWDVNRQCLWDKIAQTRVIHARAKHQAMPQHQAS